MKRLDAFIGRFAGPLYLLTVLGMIAFVLYVGVTANQNP